MKVLVYIILGILLMLFESSLASRLPMDFFKPDFATPLIIYVTLFVGAGAGFITTLCLGLVQEGLSATPNGAILFVTISLYLITAFMNKQLYIDSKYSFGSVCFAAVLFESFLFLVLSLFAKGEAKNVYNIFFYSAPYAAITGLASVLIYSCIEYINSNFLERE